MGYVKVLLTFCLVLCFDVAQATIQEKDPVLQVKQVSEQLLSRIESQRNTLEQDSRAVSVLAEELVFPYVDVTKMARFVMGANWRTASSDQQQAFVSAFKQLMLTSYARSFLKMHIDRLDMGSVRAGSGKNDVEVPVTVIEKTGNQIPVIFRLLPAENSWKVFDIEIQGVSLLLNYRSLYSTEIQTKGLSAVIAQMQSQVAGQ